ncbi:Suppressor protein MPT5 [Candida viswanathii]|uniref:Suppressor protein MPT5 n=1 Tax=Candida viswanathii TaxID=5486 RepID=A0A367YC69_9ASCO|nr:Suppressor protein MPT5 [Candida viswanathii]
MSTSSTSKSSSLHMRSLSNGYMPNSKGGTTGTSSNSKSILWDSSNKLNQNLNLPNFSIDNEVVSTPLIVPHNGNHSQQQQHPPVPQQGTIAAGAFDDKENMIMSKSIVSTAPTVASFANNSHDNHVSVATGDKTNGGGAGAAITNAVGVSTFVAAPAGTGSATSGCTPSSSASTPSDFTTTMTPPIRIPQKIDKEYLSSINKLPLVQLKLEILKLAKDQYGCRFLQKKIDESLVPSYQVRLANFDIIFNQIYPYMYELIIDPFGNYLIQKLIAYCNESNLDLLMEILQYNLFQISINQHGTRALQKIIDNLNNAHQLGLLIKGLKPYIIELIKDLNGNHVIQKILNKYQPPDCQFIYDSIIDDLYIVATHKHGCCVLQKCLNHVTLQQLGEFSRAILKFENFKLLINDQFGNYVLQYLISINSLDINFKIFQNFITFGISNLCNLKFSSNVVEKFLKNCFTNETVSLSFANLKFELIYIILINDLNVLINDPYGNYVIQTMIDIIVNPQVNYQNASVDKLSLILPQEHQSDDVFQLHQKLQIEIIKYWFQNCKIVSSFGKRIQSKINTILNNNVSSSSVSVNKSNRKSQMNANGEFIVNDFGSKQSQQQQQQSGPPQPLSYRSASSPAGVGFIMSGNSSNNNAAAANNNNNNEFYSKIHQPPNRNFSLPTNFYAANVNNNNNNNNNNNSFNVNNKNNVNSSVTSFQSGSTNTGPFNNNSASNSVINMNGNNNNNNNNNNSNQMYGEYMVSNEFGVAQQQQQQQQAAAAAAAMQGGFYQNVGHHQQSSISSLNNGHSLSHYTTGAGGQSYTPPPVAQIPGVAPPLVQLPPPNFYNNGMPPPPHLHPQQHQPPHVMPPQQQQQPTQQQQNMYHSHNPSWSSTSSFGGNTTVFGSNNW